MNIKVEEQKKEKIILNTGDIVNVDDMWYLVTNMPISFSEAKPIRLVNLGGKGADKYKARTFNELIEQLPNNAVVYSDYIYDLQLIKKGE